MSTPTPDDDQSMRDALQRDAARVSEPAFDAALHYETMRRVRALAETKSATPRWHLAPTLTAAAAVVALSALIALWPHSSAPTKPREVVTSLAPRTAAPRASLLAYQAAANDGDAALLALLDRDASTLLPASSPLFNATLP
ncbi:MAG: hypothetical protein ABJF10_21505 [Chthoniobacter sp.]|uniref:hypothetical protein n=1 Tax=Chthoniobacter sp. TaxID=2510640 RepID=UPI0032A1EB2C